MNFQGMQVDKEPFQVNTIDLGDKKVLLRPEQADKCLKGSVVIGDPRTLTDGTKVLAREVVMEKTPDGQDTLKITIKGAGHGGQAQSPPAQTKQQ